MSSPSHLLRASGELIANVESVHSEYAITTRRRLHIAAPDWHIRRLPPALIQCVRGRGHEAQVERSVALEVGHAQRRKLARLDAPTKPAVVQEIAETVTSGLSNNDHLVEDPLDRSRPRRCTDVGNAGGCHAEQAAILPEERLEASQGDV